MIFEHMDINLLTRHKNIYIFLVDYCLYMSSLCVVNVDHCFLKNELMVKICFPSMHVLDQHSYTCAYLLIL